MVKDGWDTYFVSGFCGGTVQPGFVVRCRGRWFRTKHRVNPAARADVISEADVATIKAALPKLPYGNALFHDYLRRAKKPWSEVPLLDVSKLRTKGSARG